MCRRIIVSASQLGAAMRNIACLRARDSLCLVTRRCVTLTLLLHLPWPTAASIRTTGRISRSLTSAALGATPECQTKTGGHSTSLPTACCVQVLSIVTATVARRAAAARCRRTVTFPTAMSASRTSSLALVGSTCPHTERGGRVNQTRRAHRTAVRRVRRTILTQANSGACGFPSW